MKQLIWSNEDNNIRFAFIKINQYKKAEIDIKAMKLEVQETQKWI